MGFPTLYAKAKTGKIKQWKVSVEGSTITVLHGQVGGKQTPQITHITEGKNIGKSNETTPEVQAKLEAGSKWNHQLDKDYRESVEDIPQSTLPPLAKKFQDASAALGDEYDTLCKFDGVRCTMFYNEGNIFFQSRGGKPYPVIKEIAKDLYDSVWKSWPSMVIDGELYCHGMFLEDITSAVKKHNKDTSRIKFHVFDLFNPEKPDQIWEVRYLEYQALVTWTDRVETIWAKRVKTEPGMTAEDKMLKLHDEFVAKKYEGVVCRKPDSLFVFGHRTSDFQKYKVPLDKEFKVIRFDIDKNGCAVPICYIENEKYPDRCEFKAPLVGTREYQREVAQNQENYIGKYLKTVFESYSKYGVPLKPKGHVFREMDEDGNANE